jgi:D-aminoacyl-tRNA deacylase
MKALLQRVTEAKVVWVDTGDVVGKIGPGLTVLVCTDPGDGLEEAQFFARKIVNMRLFEDDDGKMNRSVLDTGGSILVVSQFTLAASWRKGNRPSFSGAADPELAEHLYEKLVSEIARLGVPVETGRFRSHMQISLTNDGPVTIWMDSDDR